VYALGELIVGFAFETSPGFGLAYAAPLLEEEGDFALAAFISQRENPVFSHGAGTCSALSTDNHPINTPQIQLSNIF
jgi:hypothetical protein